MTMMKSLLIVFFALLPSFIFGQEIYKPFLEEGKVWTYHYYNEFTGHEFYESLAVSGDTIVDNKSYKRITYVETGNYRYGMREDGQKVFATYPHYTGEVLLYDFGLNEGDAFQLYDDDNGSNPNAWATVVSVDTVVVGNRAFRVLDVRPKDMMDWPNWWVEGIGGMNHLTSNYLSTGNCYVFSSCQLDGETVFTHKDCRTVGIKGQPIVDGKRGTSFFDLQGRRLNSQPSKGIYIRDRRKVVVR